MLRKVAVFVVIFQLFVFPLYAQPAQPECAADTYKPSYNPFRKLMRGVMNTAFSVVEIPTQMINVGQAEGDMAGISWGLLKGIFCMGGRTVWGMFETATFIIPPYRPIVKPEFIFSEEE